MLVSKDKFFRPSNGLHAVDGCKGLFYPYACTANDFIEFWENFYLPKPFSLQTVCDAVDASPVRRIDGDREFGHVLFILSFRDLELICF
jgi:hypothetical protein